MNYYPVEARVTPLVTIRRERILPVEGEVLVGVGEMVGPADVVARCQLPGSVRVVDASRALRVPRHRAERYLLKSPGDSVQVNETVAAPGGLLGRLRRSCRSPVDGQIVDVRDGLILIQPASTTFELEAHLKGQVTNIMPRRGVVISAVGALIQAFWGCGGEADGVLKLVVDNPMKPLRARSIDVSCQGTIAVGGRILDEATLDQAVEAKVRGMIVGSVDAVLIPYLRGLPFPIIVTEGFGSLPMSEPVFGLLHSNMGREAMMNAETSTRWGARRPEVLIPLRAEDSTPEDSRQPKALRVGDLVRVLRAPHLGALGTVIDLPDFPQMLESGSRVPAVLVELDDADQPVAIPVVNVELVR
ncbi:MAG: hypothetical protein JXA93_10090 [Anaerolineae bacterium]|nr:hypothetical protein [Anaerolineae bacterium]